MNDPFQLVTNCTFKGKDYLVQMCVLNLKKLELIITDKLMGENWQCEYDSSYIEALTHKTGNFKQFDVFVMMLKSGLLKTSDCITLDLLTIEDLEQLSCRKIVNSHFSSRTTQSKHLNKRYLILTYSVEFDRIHYPLPLDYCGPPDPTVLQSTIRRLENEIERLKHKNIRLSKTEVGNARKLKEKVLNLTDDNTFLTNEIHRLNKLLSKRHKPEKNNQILQNSLKNLEEQVIFEKKHNQQLILQLRAENKKLKQQVEELKKSEKCFKMKCRDFIICKKRLGTQMSPKNSLDKKRDFLNERVETQFLYRPVDGFNSSSDPKPNTLKRQKKPRNRFLSSSSSDSEKMKSHRTRSKEKKQLLCTRQDLSFRRSSNERSRQSSVDSKKNLQIQKSGLSLPKRSDYQDGKRNKSNCLYETQPHKKAPSRESSLSSKGSSKQSKVSRFSNRGSGDYRVLKSKQTPRSILGDKEDLKFSMSDLEKRIHALQKLLSEGLSF